MLFNIALEYAIRRVEVNQNGFKLNATHQVLVYTDGVKILGGNIRTTKNSEAKVVVSKEIGIKVNTDKSN